MNLIHASYLEFYCFIIYFYLALRLGGISFLFYFYNFLFIWSCGFYGDFQFDYVKILFVFFFILVCLIIY